MKTEQSNIRRNEKHGRLGHRERGGGDAMVSKRIKDEMEGMELVLDEIYINGKIKNRA